ncbi:2'-5' RNA ligase family protein [Clostridium sp. ZBS15]|uniref:2'-5' RNA ligase family protein n=1 Tax=Clostridium sp. ZBS15 TaxID=2949969 RepID=UPI002079D784|nr:2'-5' RNA ligase family protein [Clostridium sp. ZBS15]
MRYVVVCVVKGEAGDFNNNLRRELFKNLKAKSSKLPAHFTIKAPFEYDGDIIELINILEEVTQTEKTAPFKISGYDHFGDRVVYMNVEMSDEGKIIHDKIIEKMSLVPYIEFDKSDGKDKTFHITLASKRIRSIYTKIWEYINQYSCEFECLFDNVTIYNWTEGTWKVYKEFKFKK